MRSLPAAIGAPAGFSRSSSGLSYWSQGFRKLISVKESSPGNSQRKPSTTYATKWGSQVGSRSRLQIRTPSTACLDSRSLLLPFFGIADWEFLRRAYAWNLAAKWCALLTGLYKQLK